MVVSRNRSIVTLATVVFLLAQSLIFAGIPGGHAPEARVRLVVKSGTGVFSIGQKLKEEGLIHSSGFFAALSLLYRGRLVAGEYDLGKEMSTMEIVKKMGRGERNIYALRILEGHNLYDIAGTIEKAGIMKSEQFTALSADKAFLARLGIKAESLEGFLMPDTYFFSKETDVETFIEGIARRTSALLAQTDMVLRMKELNFSALETLTLASMIEKEAKARDEKPVISAVFHNRLRKGMSLDCDPTVIYGTKAFHSPITRSHLTTQTPYNTYAFKGLPKGPICNPDRASIAAALNPSQADYFYFVSRNDGTHVFSKDLREHSRFVAQYQRSRINKTL